MAIEITPSGQSCGAEIRGVDLTAPIDADTVAAVRAAWLDHQVLSFPDQAMTDDDLERFTQYFGPFGDDPYIEAIEGHPHVAAIHRPADEEAPIFAENWHADWTFQAEPPDGTCLFGIVVPPVGGDTEYVNQYAVYEALPDDLRARADAVTAIHSAKAGYGRTGLYGENDAPRATKLRFDDAAEATQTHPLVRVHPETGRRALYGCIGYICGIEGLGTDEATGLLMELYRWQDRPEFRYVHRWAPNTLAMWDNRCVLHRATGGFDGHERLMHRTTIGYNRAVRTG